MKGRFWLWFSLQTRKNFQVDDIFLQKVRTLLFIFVMSLTCYGRAEQRGTLSRVRSEIKSPFGASYQSVHNCMDIKDKHLLPSLYKRENFPLFGKEGKGRFSQYVFSIIDPH